jgi:hypothetical protein
LHNLWNAYLSREWYAIIIYPITPIAYNNEIALLDQFGTEIQSEEYLRQFQSESVALPSIVDIDEKVIDVTAGGYFTALLTEHGHVYQWGIGTPERVRIQFPNNVKITRIVAGGTRSYWRCNGGSERLYWRLCLKILSHQCRGLIYQASTLV